MPLSESACRAAKPREKVYKIYDAEGLYLQVQPNGSRLWRMDYSFAKKRKTLSFGAYPAITLGKARELRFDARTKLALGIDPSAAKKSEAIEAGRTFEAVARDWLDHWKVGKDPAHVARVESRLTRDAFSELGQRHIASIEAPDILAMIRRVEGRGALDIARRLRQTCDQVFRFAKAAGMVKHNPASADLLEAMKPRARTQHMASLKAEELPGFMRKLAAYDGDRKTALAIRFTLLTWVRTNETRFAKWSEFEDIDGEEPLWKIPADRMKMGREHLVPLSSAAVAMLRELDRSTEWVFPGLRGPLSANTMIYGLYRMGFHSRATIHGFRGTASTMANEHGWASDWVERQLAHVEENKIRGAYNAAEWLSGRRAMMEWWAGVITAAEQQDEFDELLMV